jgi:hypothetical protein
VPPLAPEPAPQPAPPATEPPREPAWLEALAPAERRRARLRIDELERLGIAHAGNLVRRDMEPASPEVARALLRRRLSEIVGRASDPRVAHAVLVEVLRLLTVTGREVDAAAGLPGWRLLETVKGEPARRIELDADDLTRPRAGSRRRSGS